MSTSHSEVSNISPEGFRVLVDDRELFLPFDLFPWFKAAAVQAIHNVGRPQPGHLYWPDLDVDFKRDMTGRMRYTVIVERGETGWGAHVPGEVIEVGAA